jgi:hypothetical protein
MNVQRALSSRHSDACTCQAVNLMHGRASSTTFVSASVRAVRPASLAASAGPEWFDTGSRLCAEPALGIEEKACLPAHSFLGGPKKPMFRKAPGELGQVTACSVRMQALRRSTKPNTRGRAAPAALPNPSIERDVQGLAPLAAPHVKR